MVIDRKTFFLLGLVLFVMACGKDIAPEKNKYSDSDNMLIINGKRTFIIGSYHHPKTAKPFETLAENGYNYVRVNADVAELDKALKNNLNTWIYTNAVDIKDKVKGKEKLADKIREFKDHLALLFWEIEDEPAWKWNEATARVSPERMKEAYDIIKTEDSRHAIITNHAPTNLVSTLKKYNSATDIVAVDVYPVIPHGIKPTYALFSDGLQSDLLNPYISQVGEYVDKMKAVVGNDKPVFAVLQGFSWEMLKPEKERNSSMVLYPTYEQSRFMAYDAIVHGATGILYWGTNYTPQPSKFMDDLNMLTRELAEMQDVLSSRIALNSIETKYHEIGHSVDAGVQFITKKVNNSTYLITVNSDKNPVKVTFSGLGKYKSVEVLKENRSMKISKGKLTEYYKPFDVHIYKLSKQ